MISKVHSEKLGVKAVQLVGYQPLVAALQKAEKIAGDFLAVIDMIKDTGARPAASTHSPDTTIPLFYPERSVFEFVYKFADSPSQLELLLRRRC